MILRYILLEMIKTIRSFHIYRLGSKSMKNDLKMSVTDVNVDVIFYSSSFKLEVPRKNTGESLFRTKDVSVCPLLYSLPVYLIF